MTECPVCEGRIVKEWGFCPHCGLGLREEKGREERIQQQKYRWERNKRIKFIQENLQTSMRADYNPIKNPVREKIGDYVHIDLFPIHISLLLLNYPQLSAQIKTAAQLTGYHTTKKTLNKTETKKTTWWQTLQKPQTQKKLQQQIKQTRWAEIEKITVNKKNKTIHYHIKDAACFMQTQPPQNQCCLTYYLTGLSEAIYDTNWNSQTTKCQLHNCEIKTQQTTKTQTTNKAQKIKQKLAQQALDYVTQKIAEKQPSIKRKKLGDTFHINIMQTLNYLLIEQTPGHKTLTKHAGLISGKKITEKTQTRGLEEALQYIQELHQYLKTGDMSWEKKTNHMKIEIKESIYSAGIKNTDTKLCTYLEGLMQGILNQATDERWEIIETRCSAQGSDRCTFHGKKLP